MRIRQPRERAMWLNRHGVNQCPCLVGHLKREGQLVASPASVGAILRDICQVHREQTDERMDDHGAGAILLLPEYQEPGYRRRSRRVTRAGAGGHTGDIETGSSNTTMSSP